MLRINYYFAFILIVGLIVACTPKKPVLVGSELKTLRATSKNKVATPVYYIDGTLGVYVQDYVLGDEIVSRLYFIDSLGYPVYYQNTKCELKGDEIYVYSLGTGKSSYQYSVSNAKLPSLDGNKFTFFVRDDHEIEIELDEKWRKQVFQWLTDRNNLVRDRIKKWNANNPEDPVKPDLDEEE